MLARHASWQDACLMGCRKGKDYRRNYHRGNVMGRGLTFYLSLRPPPPTTRKDYPSVLSSSPKSETSPQSSNALYPQPQVQGRCFSPASQLFDRRVVPFALADEASQGNKSFVAFSNLNDGESLTQTWKVRFTYRYL